MWFQIDLNEAVNVAEIQLDAAGGGRLGGGGGRSRGAAPTPAPVPGYPRQYQVQLSLDGHPWGPRRGVGERCAADDRGVVPGARRFIRITETADAQGSPAWVIQNLRVYRAP